MNELAKIGVTLTFMSLGEKNIMSKMKADGNPMTRKELEKEMTTEMTQIVKEDPAKIEKKYHRPNYPHYSRNHYFT